jgi:hypothetical protein
MIYHIFIGYDDREKEAFEACKESILAHTSEEVVFHKLDHRKLRKDGFFKRHWIVEGHTGRYLDVNDNKNFSTQFSHSRFLVPVLAKNLKISESHVMFIDCDFIFLGDIKELFDIAIQNNKPVSVVKQIYEPDSSEKMDGQVQEAYPMKLWSSLMIFDITKPEIKNLSIEYVNRASGVDLHRFKWLGSGNIEALIGELPSPWNFIPEYSKGEPLAIHYTEGIPLMEGYEKCQFANEFYKYYVRALENKLIEMRVKRNLCENKIPSTET